MGNGSNVEVLSSVELDSSLDLPASLLVGHLLDDYITMSMDPSLANCTSYQKYPGYGCIG